MSRLQAVEDSSLREQHEQLISLHKELKSFESEMVSLELQTTRLQTQEANLAKEVQRFEARFDCCDNPQQNMTDAICVCVCVCVWLLLQGGIFEEDRFTSEETSLVEISELEE